MLTLAILDAQTLNFFVSTPLLLPALLFAKFEYLVKIL